MEPFGVLTPFSPLSHGCVSLFATCVLLWIILETCMNKSSPVLKDCPGRVMIPVSCFGPSVSFNTAPTSCECSGYCFESATRTKQLFQSLKVMLVPNLSFEKTLNKTIINKIPLLQIGCREHLVTSLH